MQTFKTQGFAELDRALSDLGKSTGRNVLKRVAMRAMKPLEEKMAALAPKATGDLANSMRTQPITAKRQRGQKNFSPKTSYSTLTGPAPEGALDRANAGFQEFGTVKMPANSYARPAADTEVEPVIDFIRTALAEEIDKAAKRAAKKAAKLRG